MTVLPGTGLSFASRSVTVIVEAVAPSATTEAGDATADECGPITAPGVKLTDAVCVIATRSVVSTAV